MDKAPRKPKQLHRKDEFNKSDQYMNYDLFPNDECTSFLSSSFCSSMNKNDASDDQIVKPTHSNSILDITTDDIQAEQSRTNIKFMPILYLLTSGITLFGGIISSFYQRKQQFDILLPQFLELPFRQIHLFQVDFFSLTTEPLLSTLNNTKQTSHSFLNIFNIQKILPISVYVYDIAYILQSYVNCKENESERLGIALTSMTGIINYCITYMMWKQSKYEYNNIQFFNCWIGVFSQISIFAFSILPVAMPNNLNLRSEDCLLLNLYFALSFLYQCIYIFCLIRSVPKTIKMAYSYQIRTAFFIICALVFMFYASSSILGVETSDNASQKQMIQNANSICAFILFGLNTVFISLFYFDLKTVNLILKFAHIQDVKNIRKFNQNIL